MQYKIKCGGAEGIADTLGGELISYKRGGREYIWTGDAAHWSGHAPVLFPFVSALKNNKVSFGGREYEMKGKHGFARKSEFELVSLAENEAVFRLAANETTLAQYPYRFELYVTHRVWDGCYMTEYKVKNAGDGDMLFCLGGHPGFTVDGSAEDYKLIFEKEEDCELYYTDAASLYDPSYKTGLRIKGREFEPRYGDFDVDALIAKDIKSRRVRLIRKSDGAGIDFDYNGFPVLVLWSPPKKRSPFICLEPWIGLPAMPKESGRFEDKPYAISLPSGGEYSANYKVSAIR